MPFPFRFSAGHLLSALSAAVFASFWSRAAPQLEILALRHQLGVVQRSVKRPKLTPTDRWLWAWLCAVWDDWQSSIFVVKASTVIGWHRKGFRLFWAWKIRHGKPRRPAVAKEVRALIRIISRQNPLWGAPRNSRRVAQAGHRHRRDQRGVCSWCLRTTVGAFCILASPLIPPPSGPSAAAGGPPLGDRARYLLRDRDRIFGADFVTQLKSMGIQQVLSAPRSPWQRAYVERVIGTIRREWLDHVIVFSEASLYRHLRNFADYYHRRRTHLGLQRDTPESRPVHAPQAGRIVAIPEVGGLHHRYERRAV